MRACTPAPSQVGIAAPGVWRNAGSAAGFDALHRTEAVPVQHRAVEEIRDRGEADMRMGPHVVVVLRACRDRPEMVEEDEGADTLPRKRGQQPAHDESAADVLVAWAQRCFDGHHASCVIGVRHWGQIRNNSSY